jgi:PKD repeat protein
MNRVAARLGTPRPSRRIPLFVVLSIVVALGVPYPTDAAPVYSFSTIAAGGTGTATAGVNSLVQIVGTVYNGYSCNDYYGCWPSSPLSGFLWDSGTFTTINVPGAYDTETLGINGAGQVVGWFSDATGTHGFLKDGDTLTTFDVPGASGTVARGINSTGQIVGTFWDLTGTRGFLKDGDTFTTIDVPGASGSYVEVTGINDVGQIVGWVQSATGNRGFLKDGDKFTIIDVPGAYGTKAYGINGTGQIVGTFWDLAGNHGFLKDGDTFTALDAPDASSTGASFLTGTTALGLNDTGRMVGFFWDDYGETTFGFLAVPTGSNNTPPVASFTFACDGLACTFNGSGSTDLDGTIASYFWDVGNKTIMAGATVSHAYTAAGTYTVTLRITDNAGAISTQSQSVTVPNTVPNTPPVASFTFECDGLACTFNGSGSTDLDGTIASYAWTFGDGTTGAGTR